MFKAKKEPSHEKSKRLEAEAKKSIQNEKLNKDCDKPEYKAQSFDQKETTKFQGCK